MTRLSAALGLAALIVSGAAAAQAQPYGRSWSPDVQARASAGGVQAHARAEAYAGPDGTRAEADAWARDSYGRTVYDSDYDGTGRFAGYGYRYQDRYDRYDGYGYGGYDGYDQGYGYDDRGYDDGYGYAGGYGQDYGYGYADGYGQDYGYSYGGDYGTYTRQDSYSEQRYVNGRLVYDYDTTWGDHDRRRDYDRHDGWYDRGGDRCDWRCYAPRPAPGYRDTYGYNDDRPPAYGYHRQSYDASASASARAAVGVGAYDVARIDNAFFTGGGGVGPIPDTSVWGGGGGYVSVGSSSAASAFAMARASAFARGFRGGGKHGGKHGGGCGC